VMTIHKSKGLGAPVVIMPLADWRFEKSPGSSRTVLWCRPEGAPFNRAPLVPVEYTRLLLMSRFAGDFMQERFSAYLDNLNLLYVAFTRARERLYVQVPEKGAELAALVANTLGQLHRQRPQDSAEHPALRRDEDAGIWEAGSPQPPRRKESGEGTDVDAFPAGKALQRLRIAGKGREYFLLTKGGYQERIDRGTLYHAILAGIVTAADVERAVQRTINAGLVRAGEKERLMKEVRSFLRQEGAEEWFAGDYQVKKEADIILPDGRILRPDRVMIRGGEAVVVDYKFGAVEEEAYIRQVRRYMQVLQDMGYEKVKGVVWYVMLQKMIVVNA